MSRRYIGPDEVKGKSVNKLVGDPNLGQVAIYFALEVKDNNQLHFLDLNSTRPDEEELSERINVERCALPILVL